MLVTAAAALLAAAAGAGAGTAVADPGSTSDAWPKLRQYNAQEFYFLAPEGKVESANRYTTILYAENPPGRDELDAKDVKAVYDLSSLEGKVTIDGVAGNCSRTDWTVACTLGDFYQQTYVDPFVLHSVKGVPVGEAGAVKERITSSNAGTVEHTRRVFIGKPDIRVGTHAPYTIPESERGSLPPITPAFGNDGQVALPGPLVLSVHLSWGAGTFTGEKYSNCFYSPDGRDAHCRFDQDLPPAAAFETDGAFRGTTDPCCRVKGAYTYAVWSTRNPPEYRTDPFEAGRKGDGRVLGLKPVGIDTLPGRVEGTMEYVSAGEWQADWTVDGITLRGKVGQTVEVPVPSARNLGPDEPEQRVEHLEVTLPEGVTLVPQPHEEIEYCQYAQDGRTAVCTQDSQWSYLKVRIDKKVEGARGTVKVVLPEGSADPDLSNNTAPVTLEIVDPSGASPSAGASAPSSPTPSATATGGSPSAAATTPTGSMAATGTPATPLLAGAAAAAVALGAALVAAHRRRGTTGR
jgi:hypothetical protein